MPLTPDFQNWQQVMDLIKQSADDEQHSLLLTMLMTPDERDVLLARVNIFHELLKGDLSQRQVSQLLGVGIATITRGSNELKNHSEMDKEWLQQLLSGEREAN
ncbi:MAG: trp operon repressor [Aliivibrio sp.]|uniref:trp operon repressor n=1 Tax=Aliivibrio sp. TaxID=1872443 RepID=UPI001A4C1DE5|nr:trp operon repressor [Aliivibrio sp.]